jgi:adenylate cyclase
MGYRRPRETLVQQLARSPEKLVLGGEERKVTVLFSDVRGFTTISESYKHDPQGLTRLMNRFLTPLTNAIIERNSTIDKYIGDAIMAFWNAPLDDPQQEVNACEAALEMLARADKLNQQFKHAADQNGGTYRPLHVGIGLNTGPCVVGNMGSDFRFNYSVLGGTVNVASRLEGRTKDYRIPIVIGAGTEQNAREKFATLEIDRIQVKGKTEPETVFTLLGRADLVQNPNFRELRDLTAKMLGYYREQDWTQALAAIELCRKAAEPFGISALFDITPNASRRSAVIRRHRIGTASTRPRANSLFKPAALARASQEQKR